MKILVGGGLPNDVSRRYQGLWAFEHGLQGPYTGPVRQAVRIAYGSLAKSETIPLDWSYCEPATEGKKLRHGYYKEESGSVLQSDTEMQDLCGNPTRSEAEEAKRVLTANPDH